ncbi:hypothetical protein DFH06DRAFT_1176074 [Mycena polygramma]|nr:hypothetical protein DFH06DRAFT_1176074 [Mycena polygramma]
MSKHFCQFLRRLSNKARKNSVPAVNTDVSRQESIYRTSSPANMAGTAGNVLKFALETLSCVSANIPLGGVLSSVIDPLLAIAERIEGLVKLAAAACIELLTPLVSKMAEKNLTQGRPTIEDLRQELHSITTELEEARTRGKVNQFSNSIDNASVLEKHNQALAQMIAAATFATLQDVLESLRELEINGIHCVNSYLSTGTCSTQDDRTPFHPKGPMSWATSQADLVVGVVTLTVVEKAGLKKGQNLTWTRKNTGEREISSAEQVVSAGPALKSAGKAVQAEALLSA